MQRRYFRFSLFGIMVLLSGCNQARDFRHWLQISLGVSKPAVEESFVARAPSTRCCWCKKANTNDNDVRMHSPDVACSDRPNELSDCKIVSVEGDNCSLVSVRDMGDRLACEKTSLFYLERNQRLEISPPAGPVFPCDASKMIEAQPTGPVKIVDAYCTCGRDPQNDKNCSISMVDGPRTTFLESRPRPENQKECHMQLCFDFYLEKYKNICPPRYVQGNP